MKKTSVLKKVCLSVAICLFATGVVNAQDQVGINLGADLVNSYVWRGNKQTGFSIQPTLGASYKGVTLSAWGSTDISNGTDEGFKEVDFSLSYEVAGLKVAVTDYWWDGEGAYRYFSSPSKGYSGHLLEATLGYTLSESFPLSVTWNTFLMGVANKKENGDNSFSTYVELAYPFTVSEVDMSLAAGFVPWESAVYGPKADGFKVTNLMLNAEKGIKFSDSFTLPVFGSVIFNPAVEDVHFVFGVRLGIN